MSIDAPFLEPGTHIFQEKWNVIFCAFRTAWITKRVALSSARWIQIGSQINWTSGRGRFIFGEVEERNGLGLEQAHHLEKEKYISLLYIPCWERNILLRYFHDATLCKSKVGDYIKMTELFIDDDISVITDRKISQYHYGRHWNNVRLDEIYIPRFFRQNAMCNVLIAGVTGASRYTGEDVSENYPSINMKLLLLIAVG